MLDAATGPLTVGGRRVETVAYVYCVGSRQEPDGEHPDGHAYCSRYCCTATVHAASLLAELDPSVTQYHLFRDMRTYGKYELLYNQALAGGSLFIKFDKDEPPTVAAKNGALVVEVKDQLMGGTQLEIPADLVVLVTGMVPRANDELVDILKLPVGRDGFFNEIHPKLRPVETMVNGVLIAGASQSPKTLAESVASSLAAASKGAALLLKGYVELEPFVARVDVERCTGCDDCLSVCPYEALEKVTVGGRPVVRVSPSLCKGGGACVPACPEGAIDVIGYSNREIVATIEALAREVAHA
jgi:heterodisulfide reductase subunit A